MFNIYSNASRDISLFKWLNQSYYQRFLNLQLYLSTYISIIFTLKMKTSFDIAVFHLRQAIYQLSIKDSWSYLVDVHM